MTPRYVLSERIDAESPLHAGLLFAKMSVGIKKAIDIGMIIHKVKGGTYEVHAKKKAVGGSWVFHGQVYKDNISIINTR